MEHWQFQVVAMETVNAPVSSTGFYVTQGGIVIYLICMAYMLPFCTCYFHLNHNRGDLPYIFFKTGNHHVVASKLVI